MKDQKNTNEPSKEREPADNAAGDSAEITLPKSEYDQLVKRLQELEALRDRLVLSAADFENAKKRLTRERDDFVKFSQENLIRSLLPVLDNFERALSHGDDARKNAQGVISGIQMVFKQLNEILKNQGLKRLQTVGQVFDPHQHEAVSFTHEPGKEDEIAGEVEPGYMLHDRLLRAAKVKVRLPQPSQSEEDEKQDNIT